MTGICMKSVSQLIVKSSRTVQRKVCTTALLLTRAHKCFPVQHNNVFGHSVFVLMSPAGVRCFRSW